VSNENKRLFFAVNLPQEIREWIGKEILPLISKEGWRPVKEENLHVTIHFLGQLPAEAVDELEGKVKALQKFEAFDAEIKCAGHFKGRVLWLGFGKGVEEFGLLNRKLQKAIGVSDERFHAHITIARNRGGKDSEKVVESIGKVIEPRVVCVKSLELMESVLGETGPDYKRVFSLAFIQGGLQPS